MKAPRNGGFTLIELMIVVAVVAILAALAYPSYQEQMQRSRRTDGHAALMRAMSLQERNYTEFGVYTSAVNPAVSEEGFYSLAAASIGGGWDSGVQITATPQGAQANDPCGALTLSSTGARGAAGGADACW